MPGSVDFIYLPVNFKRRSNAGYAFISFRTEQDYCRFVESFNGRDPRTVIPGLCDQGGIHPFEVSPAHHQGLEQNVSRLQESQVMWQLLDFQDWLPVLFDAQGNLVEFPLPHAAQAALDCRRRAEQLGLMVNGRFRGHDEELEEQSQGAGSQQGRNQPGTKGRSRRR